MKTLIVLGATGLMGRRICAMAERDLPEVRLLRAARGVEDGEGTRKIDLGRNAVPSAEPGRDALAEALGEADCLINAVGPYDYDPKPLLEACVDARCHYVDIAEDPTFHLAAVSAAGGLAGEDDVVALVPGCSTVPGMIDLLAQRWADEPRAASLDAWLSMGSRNPTSPTLLTSLLRTLRGRAPGGQPYFSSLTLRESPDGRALAYGRYPFPGEHDGLRIGGHTLPLAFHVGFDRRLLVRGLILARPLLERLRPEWLGRLSRAGHPLFGLVSRFGTTRGCLEVVARDASGAELGSVGVLAKREGLDIPAAPALWAAGALLREPRGDEGAAGGLLRLADLVSTAEASQWLERNGYEVVAR